MLDKSSGQNLRATGTSSNSNAVFKLREKSPGCCLLQNSHKDEISHWMKICTPYMVPQTLLTLHSLPTLRYTIPYQQRHAQNVSSSQWILLYNKCVEPEQMHQQERKLSKKTNPNTYNIWLFVSILLQIWEAETFQVENELRHLWDRSQFAKEIAAFIRH